MNMNMYVYRMTEKPDSESAGETGEPFGAFNLDQRAYLNRMLRLGQRAKWCKNIR